MQNVTKTHPSQTLWGTACVSLDWPEASARSFAHFLDSLPVSHGSQSTLMSAFFGIIIVTLEMSDLICANSFKAWIEKDLKFLSVLLGRGIFHCFVGSLLFWQWGFFPIIVGCFEIFIGIVMVLVSVTTTQKLSSVKRGIIKDMHGDAMASFAKYDKDGSGYIDSREFVALSKEHGINLNENEVSAAINLLDTNRDGRISKEEFGVFLTTKRATHFFGFK
mmetsp:Transcript_10584/g.25866  ORF Transcript_10584/g.25866 Transcript_10584/m.25866 type:complete len:220 (-) Transcript_10584:271-930(-)